jgi:hypothetical protein
MTEYRNKYLEMLKAEKSKKPPGEELRLFRIFASPEHRGRALWLMSYLRPGGVLATTQVP